MFSTSPDGRLACSHCGSTDLPGDPRRHICGYPPERPPADDDLDDERSDLTAELSLHGIGGDAGQDLASDLIWYFVDRGWRPPGATVDRDALARLLWGQNAEALGKNGTWEGMDDEARKVWRCDADGVLALLAGEETTDG